MIEVCFNDAVKGILTYCGLARKPLNIYLGLSEGDIDSDITLGNCPRFQLIRSWMIIHPHGELDKMEKQARDFWTSIVEDLEVLKNAPKEIRIWADHTPNAKCGLMHIADLLENSKTDIYVVQAPETITRDDNCVVVYRGWGEVEPELCHTFALQQRLLQPEEIKELSDGWKRLRRENAPVRVVENQVVKSANLNYYDDLIRKEFPKYTCKIAEIIGNALCKQKLITGDIFIAKRIQTFIDNGELAIQGSTHAGFYRTTVQTVKIPPSHRS